MSAALGRHECGREATRPLEGKHERVRREIWVRPGVSDASVAVVGAPAKPLGFAEKRMFRLLRMAKHVRTVRPGRMRVFEGQRW